MRLFSRSTPKIKVTSSKKDGFSGWLKCTHCTEMIHTNELQSNLTCCPKCDYHYRLSAKDRVDHLIDPETFQELFKELESIDTLSFVDTQPYSQRLEEAKEKTGSGDAVTTGEGLLSNVPVAFAAMDFNFMGGSMGAVVGEKLTRLIEYASKKYLPLIIISTSGGARMQESILSLMQMTKTSAALSRYKKIGLPYISILANPTTGGVIASFASLGDIIIAEPKALICFAGPRVIEQTIKKPLPEGAQQSEFLLEHGLIDCIITRHKLKKQLTSILEYTVSNNQGNRKKLLETASILERKLNDVTKKEVTQLP